MSFFAIHCISAGLCEMALHNTKLPKIAVINFVLGACSQNWLRLQIEWRWIARLECGMGPVQGAIVADWNTASCVLKEMQ